jgi:hypothetical protein
MLRFRAQSKALLVLLCIFVVMMRVSGAHMHLCFDGSEPPATLHMDNDQGLHHTNDRSHSDADVSLDDTLVKKFDLGFDSQVLLATLFLLIAIVPLVTLSRIRFDLLPHLHSQRAFIRPPLRGPPL